jgi:DNA-binding CsgD family transcriptional regulator
VQILQLAAEDLSAKQIARDLCISVRTVEGHFASMRSRTGCVTVGGLTAWAVASGIVVAPIRNRPRSGNIQHTLRGRPRLMTAEKIAEAADLLGEVPVTQIARQVGVSRGTVYAHMAAIRAARV